MNATELDLAAIRALFPATRDHVVLDNASAAPMSVPVANRIAAHVAEQTTTPGQMWNPSLAAGALDALERILWVPRSRISFVHSTTSGFNTLARGLPLRAGDVVVLPRNEYPATVVPWLERQRRHGVRVELLPVEPNIAGGVPLEALEAAARRPEVKVLSLSLVSWLGYRYPLADLIWLAEKHDVVLAIDGAQAVGHVEMPLGDSPQLFVASTFHKWAFGIEGIGAIVRSPELRGRMQPVLVDLKSVQFDEEHLLDYGLRFPSPSAQPILSMPAPICFVALRAGLELLLSIGPARIEGHILALSARASDGLQAIGFEVLSDTRPDHRSGIVTFSHRDRSRNPAIGKALRERRIFLRVREGLLRLSLHIYSSTDDLEQLFQALRALAA